MHGPLNVKFSWLVSYEEDIAISDILTKLRIHSKGRKLNLWVFTLLVYK